jgi:hypothetical protein
MGLQSLAIAIVVILAAAGVAMLAMVGVRRISRGPLLTDPTRGTSMATVVGTAFAILLAFIIVDAFQTYSGAKSAAEEEATATLEMFRTVGFFPDEEREAVRSDIACYARAVTYSEWPAMREGETSPFVVPWINRWNATLLRFEPQSDREHLAFEEFLAEDDERTAAGIARFRASSPAVPTPLWIALIVGAVLGVALQLAMSDPRERLAVHGAMIAAVAAILTAGLVLVDYLDHPYSGEVGSVEPTAMEFSIDAMRSIEPGLKPACTADGRPPAGASSS